MSPYLPYILIYGALFLVIAYYIRQIATNFSEKIFYSVGVFVFSTQALTNMWGLYLEIQALAPTWIIVSKIAYTFFYFVLAFFFNWLKKNNNISKPEPIGLSPEQLNDYLRDDDKSNR